MKKVINVTFLSIMFLSLCISLTYGQEKKVFTPALRFSLLGSQAADLYTTDMFMDRGGRELNPLVNWAPGYDKQKIVATIGMGLEHYILDLSVKKEWIKPKTAKKIGWSLVAVHILCAYNNVKLSQRLDERR